MTEIITICNKKVNNFSVFDRVRLCENVLYVMSLIQYTFYRRLKCRSLKIPWYMWQTFIYDTDNIYHLIMIERIEILEKYMNFFRLTFQHHSGRSGHKDHNTSNLPHLRYDTPNKMLPRELNDYLLKALLKNKKKSLHQLSKLLGWVIIIINIIYVRTIFLIFLTTTFLPLCPPAFIICWST